MEMFRMLLFIVLNFLLILRFFKNGAIDSDNLIVLISIIIGQAGTFLIVTSLILIRFFPKFTKGLIASKGST